MGSTIGNAELFGGEAIKNINDSTSAQHISKAAIDIVHTIINKDHTVDSCISLLNKFAYSELEPSVQQSYEQKLDVQKKINELEEKKDEATAEKNRLQRQLVKLETKRGLSEPRKTPDDIVRADGEINDLRIVIGNLHETRQDIEKKMLKYAGASLIREQCIEIIQDHLKKQKELQKSLPSS